MTQIPDTSVEHGGDLDRAITRFGGPREAWIDLSTGINPVPYPVPPLEQAAWAALPDRQAVHRAEAAARVAYGLSETTACVAVAGAQAAIQRMPQLAPPGPVCVIEPTYNEHARVMRAAGRDVLSARSLRDMPAHSKTLCLVSPNNPDGTCFKPEALLEVAGRVDLLVVDESFMDPTPSDSLLGRSLPPNVLVLRSFGKFYGLAGLRLGFVCGAAPLMARLASLTGPWSVSGPALEIGAQALRDGDWAARTRLRLQKDATRLDALLKARGAGLVGGTTLFRTYTVPDAAAVQAHLAQAQIWTRVFSFAPSWLRLGLPGSASAWARLETALRSLAP
ncbi:MAG: threonine-phosphate decarboxylase CobD [Pseudomonadota bacterium]